MRCSSAWDTHCWSDACLTRVTQIVLAPVSQTLRCSYLAVGHISWPWARLLHMRSESDQVKTHHEMQSLLGWDIWQMSSGQPRNTGSYVCTCSGSTVQHQWASASTYTQSLPWSAWQRQESKCSLHLCIASACLLRLAWLWLSGCPALVQVHLYTCSHRCNHRLSSHPIIVVSVHIGVYDLFCVLVNKCMSPVCLLLGSGS